MSKYLDLMVAAEEALCDLLRKTEPGTGIYLHTTLSSLRREIKTTQEQEEGETPLPPAAPAPTVVLWWRREFTVREREREVLTILADSPLTKREVWMAIRERHPDLEIYLSNTDNIVTRLYRARELDRTAEPSKNGRPRYRYFKRTALEGPIVGLQRALDASGRPESTTS